MQKVKVLCTVLCILLGGVQSYASPGRDTGTESAKILAIKGRIKTITVLIKQNPENAQAYADRAAAKMELGDVFSSIRDYSTAIELESTNVAFLQSRGEAYIEVDAFKEAYADFHAAFTLAPSTVLAYDRAITEFHLDDYEAALTDLNQVLVAEPENTKALYNRGVVKMEMEALEEAIQDFNVVLEKDPHHLEALYARGLAQGLLEKKMAKR